MDEFVLEEKSSSKMLGLTFFSKLDYTKTASKKIGTLIRSMKLPFPEVVLHLYNSIICPCMEYCYYILAGAPSCYLELLGQLQK